MKTVRFTILIIVLIFPIADWCKAAGIDTTIEAVPYKSDTFRNVRMCEGFIGYILSQRFITNIPGVICQRYYTLNKSYQNPELFTVGYSTEDGKESEVRFSGWKFKDADSGIWYVFTEDDTDSKWTHFEKTDCPVLTRM